MSTPVPAAAIDLGASIPATRQASVDSPGRLAIRRFLRHRLATAGLIISILLILSALFAPVLAPRDPLQIQPDSVQPISCLRTLAFFSGTGRRFCKSTKWRGNCHDSAQDARG